MSPEKPNKVAVIAVHGVGSPEPASTARAVAGILSKLMDDAGNRLYSNFVETSIRIPLAEPDHQKKQPSTVSSLVDQEFILKQTRDYNGAPPGTTFGTVRLHSTREKQAQVDVFELYWGDMSQMGGGLLKVLQEAFLLPFRFVGLGIVAQRSTGHTLRKGHVWRLSGFCYRWSSHFLRVVLPVLLGILLLSTTLGIPLKLGHYSRLAMGCMVAGLIGSYSFMRERLKKNVVLSFQSWLIEPSSSFIICAMLALFVFGNPPPTTYTSGLWQPLNPGHLVVLEWVLAAWFLMSWYYRREGPVKEKFKFLSEQRIGRWCTNLAFLSLLVMCYLGERTNVLIDEHDIVYPIQNAVSSLLIVYATVILLVLFFVSVLSLVAILLGTMTVLRLPASERRLTLHTVWTMGFAMVVTMVSVEFFFTGALRFLTNDRMVKFYQWSNISLERGWFFTDKDVLEIFQNLTDGVLISAVIMFAAAIFVSWWCLAPSILADLRPPENDDASVAAGSWLSNGLRIVLLTGALLYFTNLVFTVPFAYYTVQHYGSSLVAFLATFGDLFWKFALGAGATFLLKMGFTLIGSVRPVIGIALDVEMYLRQWPRTDTKKAQILDRMTSLLGVVRELEDYTHIVFITHSQGTTIAADGLRYLNLTASQGQSIVGWNLKDAHLPPVSLITMGSPLRQLYATAFPWLFSWVKDTPNLAGSAAVRQWVNLYRSADYIGRQFSKKDNEQDVYEPKKVIYNDHRFKEYCIGAGAHTHYWESVAVAAELDQLIRA